MASRDGSSGTEYTGIPRHSREFNFLGNLVGPHCILGAIRVKGLWGFCGSTDLSGSGGWRGDRRAGRWLGEEGQRCRGLNSICEWEARTMHGKLNGTNRMMAGRRTGWVEEGWGKMKEDLGLWFENCADGGTTTRDGEDGRTARGAGVRFSSQHWGLGFIV